MQAKFQINTASDTRIFLSALFYIEDSGNVYCWNARGQDRGLAAAFYMVEHFYEDDSMKLYRSLEDDVYGPWITQTARGGIEQTRSPLPDALSHELERLQSRFVNDWLFFLDDPQSQAQCQAYEAHRLPLNAVNLRLKKLGRLLCHESGCQYCTPGFDPNIVDFINKHVLRGSIASHPHPGKSNPYLPLAS